MRRSELTLVVTSLVVVAVILIGEFGAYHPGVTYGSDANDSGDWSVSCSGSFTYDALLLDSGTVEAPKNVAIYYDTSYGSRVNDGLVEVGARALDQNYYISQLTNNLNYLGVREVKMLNAPQLKDWLDDPVHAHDGLVCLSGALPANVYDGTSACTSVQWISNGGTLYWAGQQIGKYIGNADGTVSEAPTGYQTVLLGAENCTNPAEQTADRRAGTATADETSNCLRYALSLKNNNVLYAVDTSSLTPGTYLSAGYREGDYTSTCIVRNGSGQVCVMAGDFSNHQRMDLSAVIASGLCWSTEVVGWTSGTVSHGTVSGHFDTVVPANNQSVFVVIGGDFAVYGRNHHI